MDVVNTTFTTVHIEPGTLIANRYQVVERIGAGGMGMVLKVLDRHLDNEVLALKLLQPHLAQEETVFRRFLNEVRVARSLSHPNIVRIHDIGTADEGFPYISMEFVDGVSLREKISDFSHKTNNSLPFDEALRVLYQILNGVAYAHDKGIIHRDLKPANVLINRIGEVKIVDFGTARIIGMDTSLTQTGQSIGTPDYMAPEQIVGENIGDACDIYALGIIAFEMVVGERPFIADTAVAVAFKHMSEPVPNLRELVPEIPEWYANMVTSAMAKDRADRPASAIAMAKELLEHMPDLAQHTGFFSVESTIQTSAHNASNSSPANPVKEQPAPESSATPSPVATSFDLPQDADDSSEGAGSLSWDFGGDGEEDDEAKPEGVIKRTASNVSKSMVMVRQKLSPLLGVIFALSLIVFVLSAITIVRVDENLNSKAVNFIEGLESKHEINLSFMRKLLDNSKDEDVVSPPEKLTKQQEEDAKSLLPPLVLAPEFLEGAGGEQTEKSADGTETSEDPKAGSAEGDEKKAGEDDSKTTEVASKQGEDTKAADSGEEKVEEKIPTPPPPPAALVAKEMRLRQGSRDVTGSQVSVDDIRKISWEAKMSGLSKVSIVDANKRLKSEVKVNVFNSQTSSIIKTLKAEVTNRRTLKTGDAQIGGKLSPLLTAGIEGGEYRLDLISNGEVLASVPLDLFKARVSVSSSSSNKIPKVVNQNNNRIKIVREPTYIPGNNNSSSGTATKPVNTGTGGTPLKLPERNPSTTLGTPNTGGSVLPPARGTRGSRTAEPFVDTRPLGGTRPNTGPKPVRPSTGSSFNRSTLDMSNDELVRGPQTSSENAPPAEKQSYSGKIALAEERALILNISFSAGSIAGSANIAGMGEFNVKGKELSRGFEIFLYGADGNLRLTGSKRGNRLKGRFSFPSKSQNGSWNANLVQ